MRSREAPLLEPVAAFHTGLRVVSPRGSRGSGSKHCRPRRSRSDQTTLSSGGSGVFETFEVERVGELTRIWLNRTERRNAVNSTMLRELGDFFLSLETAFDTRVVVLGGRGPTFCSGADRKPPAASDATPRTRTDREIRWEGQLGRRACRAIEACDAVTIARVHGHAIGGWRVLRAFVRLPNRRTGRGVPRSRGRPGHAVELGRGSTLDSRDRSRARPRGAADV